MWTYIHCTNHTVWDDGSFRHGRFLVILCSGQWDMLACTWCHVWVHIIQYEIIYKSIWNQIRYDIIYPWNHIWIQTYDILYGIIVRHMMFDIWYHRVLRIQTPGRWPEAQRLHRGNGNASAATVTRRHPGRWTSSECKSQPELPQAVRASATLTLPVIVLAPGRQPDSKANPNC